MQNVSMGNQTIPMSQNEATPVLKNGQVIYGKITKLFPNQMAEVQIGLHKLIANINVPLQAGERFWFQVQQGGTNLVLKLLNLQGQNGTTSLSIDQLLSYFKMPKTADTAVLAEFLMKNHIPITRETFQNALQWLSTADPKSTGLSVLKLMHNQRLPFVQEVFQAIYTQEKGVPIHDSLNRLLTSIQTLQTPTANQLKEVISAIMNPKPATSETLQQLIRQWLQPNIPQEIKTGAYALLQRSGLIPDQPIDELVGRFINNIQGNPLLTELRAAIHPKSSSNEILQQLATITYSKGNPSEQMLNTLVNGLNPDGKAVNVARENIANMLMQFQNQPTSFPANERVALQQLVNQSQTLDFTNGQTALQSFKEITKMLGLQLENVLANLQVNSDERLVTLKPLLLKLLNEAQTSLALRESAEQLVNRITGQQILSQESGPLQNILLSIPLHLERFRTDLTLKWSGRKTKDGKIDPNYCRILFYLELERLEETVIDMQVQNRVVKITIINEYSERLEALSSPFISELREKLEGMDYRLSSILFENSYNTPIIKKVEGNPMNHLEMGAYNGVDIKI